MSTHKRIDIVCIAAVILSVLLAVLLMSGTLQTVIPVVNAGTGNDYFTASDLNAGWSAASATQIVLSDQGSTVTGNGAYVDDGNVCIAYAGHYVLTGALTNGSVIIEADKSDAVWLLLNGVTLHCDDDAAFRVEQADHVFLTLAAGTENTISVGGQYNEESIDAGVDGAIYSRDDLTVNGSGRLTVDGAYRHGIVCNDDLMITGGDIRISAAQDGIHANDSVRLQEAAISISAGDDGITVSNDDETAFFYMASGSISIPACYEGIEAIDITIAGGSIDIMPTDDGINANGRGENSNIRVTGGDITITNEGGRDADGLDSNGNIYIEGGSVFISVVGNGGNCALDYGSENGGVCMVSGGTVIACGGSMMAEGFDSDSTQGFLMYSTSAEAGTTITLADDAGSELISAEIPCSFTSAVLSAPGLQVGDVCTITVGDTKEQVTIDNTASGGFGFGGGGMFGGGGFSGGKPQGGGLKGREQFELPDDRQRPADMPEREAMEGREGMKDAFPAMGRIEPPDGSPEEGQTFSPDAARGRGDHAGFRQQGPERMPGQTPGGMEDASSGNPAVALVLLGASVAALLLGLLFAMIKKDCVV